MQMQQTAATSLYYTAETTSGTTDEISGKFPARGADVADQDCEFTIEVDPTLPDITTISTVPVPFADLLANTTTAPSQPVSTKVGTPVIQRVAPANNQDAYTTQGSTQGTTTQSTTPAAPATKTGLTTPQTPAAPATKTGTTTPQTPAAPATKTGTTTPATKTGATTSTTPTAPVTKTGTSTKTGTTTSTDTVQGEADLKDPNCATGWDVPTTAAKQQTKRRLEANTNKDIAKLEAYFGTKMETTLKNLPTECVHQPSPWPGPYWPTYQDGINIEWNAGEPSPAEKYATAFGLDVTDFMDKVSADNGIDSMSKRSQCSSDADCSSLGDGSMCGIRAGKSSGYCIPGWYGICHAWTPAAMLEDEPNCPVTHNGVTFQPMDLKALISDVYDGASVGTVFTGARFNGGTDSTDENGRHSNEAFRDLNPAFFHIAAANMLGNLNATFIADVTAGSEVWNQPVRGFKVYEQTEMSLEEAAQTFYGLESYPYNAAAKSIVYVKSRLSWIFETYTDGGLVSSGQVDSFTTGAYYYYLLEMDDAGAIIGGEWVYDSENTHPDFIWFPKSKPAADTVTKIGLSYADVSMLLKKSASCTDTSSSGSESAGSSASASASTSASASSTASTAASTSGSTSGVAGSASTGSAAIATEAPVTSSTGSSTGSTTSSSETPLPTVQSTGSSAVPNVPGSTTGTSSGNTNEGGDRNQGGDHNQGGNHNQGGDHNQGGNHNQGGDHNQGDNHNQGGDHNQGEQHQGDEHQGEWQQQQQQPSQRQYTQFFHWA
ncbi:hypothetical protein PHYBOEH_009540 [Phytophthora boehmeriae]|uniref:Transglutaminase elicitor n=1 Tax=Phytophthora boehmeriae TaxID=109152 RepID=A0A8T1WYP8_9STRA|nr:hypothetical protein PHYBOEH_009540 [Phytophthora boehmeriae]